MSVHQSQTWARQRSDRRRRIDYPAWLVCGPDEPLRNCIIWDISERGGRITVADAHTVPDEFILVLSRNGDFGRRCRVLSREDLQVEFYTLHPVQKIRPAVIDMGASADDKADAVDLETV